MRFALLLLLLLLVPVLTPSAQADETVVAGMSQNRVSITASFEGSEILIFGAVKRFQPVPDDAPPLEVLVAVAGPSVPLTVWRKERVAGIWVNTDAVEVDRAPSFYAVATSGPFYDVLSNVEDLRLGAAGLALLKDDVQAAVALANAEGASAPLCRFEEAATRKFGAESVAACPLYAVWKSTCASRNARFPSPVRRCAKTTWSAA